MQLHNPGYEYLKAIYHLKNAQANAPLRAASAYILPLMALQNACLAIKEYINLTGQKVVTNWEEIDWRDISIQEKVTFIYKKLEQPVRFDTGIWKDVLALFETAGALEGNLAGMQNLPREEIPEKFKSIAVDYPIYRSQAVAEEAVDLLLDISTGVNSAINTDAPLVK
jgi:hypothetical protein